MYCSIPIILSSLTLNLLAISTTANGYPIRALTSNINHTHIPFPVFLLPNSDSSPASTLTNGKAPLTTIAGATATSSLTVIISGRANDTEAGIKQAILPSSSADKGPPTQAVKAMHALKSKPQQWAELRAAAKAKILEILEFLRKDSLILKMEEWGSTFFNKAMDVIGLGGLYPGGSGDRSRPPAKVQKEVQTRRGVAAAAAAAAGAEVGEERDGKMRRNKVVIGAGEANENEN